MIKELAAFYEEFANKMEAFDPMDRDIPAEDNPQGIKCADLVQRIEVEMAEAAISGYMLNAPMSNESHDILMDLFEQTDKECQEIGEQYIDEAKTKGKDFTDRYHQNPKVQNFLKVLTFFEVNRMIKDADVMLEKFQGYINKTEELIEKEKEFNKMTHVDKLLNQSIKDIIQRFNQPNYTALVKIMISAQAFIDERRESTEVSTRDDDLQKKLDNAEQEIRETLAKIKK